MMDDRGVSNVVGYLLVFSLVVSIVAIVSVSGLNTLESVRYQEQTNNAERAFDVLADNFRDIHREGAPSRATEISLQDAQLATVETTTLNLSGWDGTGTNFSVERTSTAIVWESQGGVPTTITYVFGGVFRTQREGSSVVVPPPFEFETQRTVLPIVNLRTRGPESFSGTTVRVRGERGTPNIVYAGDASVLPNLTLDVTTARPETWKDYLDAQPGTDCSIEDAPAEGKRVVECELTQRQELFVATYPIDVDIQE